MNASTQDVIVIGGGAAGLSAALMLARARLAVTVIDAGEPRNAPAEGVHGLLARDGTPPLELVATGRAEVERYGGRVVAGEVVEARPGEHGFTVTLGDGALHSARRLLVATGLSDDLPDLPGLREQWGRHVVHCPFCHGWEVRDTAIGVVALTPRALHQARLFRQWSDDVTLFTHTLPELAEEAASLGIPIVAGEVVAVESTADRVTGLRLADGTVHGVETVAVGPRALLRAPYLAGLGLSVEQHPSGMGEYLPVDAFGHTAVPGVWAAGNVTDPSAQVGMAASQAALAAAGMVGEFAYER